MVKFISRPNELLNIHIKKVLNQYAILNKFKNIDNIVNSMINNLCLSQKNIELYKYKEIIKDIFIDVLKYHDEGKKNPFFQSFMGNQEYKDYIFTNINKYHTEISAIYYIIQMYKTYIVHITNRKIKNIIKEIVIGFAYNIQQHHTELENLDKNIFMDNLKQYYNINKNQFININIIDEDIEILNRMKRRGNCNNQYFDHFTYYTLNKLNYSILVTCDFMAVYEHIHKKTLPINIINKNIYNDISNVFYEDKLIKSIYNYKKNSNVPLSKLNKLRTEMFLESEQNLIINKNNSNIFYLEAPTGSGKTLMSLNLAFHLLDNTINKIYEVAPYNNIIEQTSKAVKEKFYSDSVLVNSRESIIYNNDNSICKGDQDKNNGDIEDINYNKSLLDNQTLNYPITLISHVKFFDILFSNKRHQNLMLPILCNSIVILDEIQSYKNNLWIHMINSLQSFAKNLNIKILIMSATLPKMKQLLEDKNYIIPSLIIDREKYYSFFKNRVKINFCLLKKEKNTIEEVCTKINNVITTTDKHRILIECLSQKTANAFYENMITYREKGFLVYLINGITNSVTREHIIKTIQQESYNKEYVNQKIILIGTQCIEAGIDIDMDVGFKDISIIDADEQFCGRIARNFKKQGIVYFFDIDNEENIYKDDYRSENNLKNIKYRIMFVNKNFNEFYNRNYMWLLKKQSENYNSYKNNLYKLQYEYIKDTMKLINNRTYKFLFNCTYKNNISAKKLWIEYNNINKNNTISYPEKMIKLSIIKKKLSKYIYNINTYNFHDSIGVKQEDNTYIIDEGYKYFDNVNQDNSLNAESILNVEAFVNHVQLFI